MEILKGRTNSMREGPSWETNNLSASCLVGPCPEPDASSPHLYSLFP